MGGAIQSHQHAHKVKPCPLHPPNPRGSAPGVGGAWLKVVAQAFLHQHALLKCTTCCQGGRDGSPKHALSTQGATHTPSHTHTSCHAPQPCPSFHHPYNDHLGTNQHVYCHVVLPTWWGSHGTCTMLECSVHGGACVGGHSHGAPWPPPCGTPNVTMQVTWKHAWGVRGTPKTHFPNFGGCQFGAILVSFAWCSKVRGHNSVHTLEF